MNDPSTSLPQIETRPSEPAAKPMSIRDALHWVARATRGTKSPKIAWIVSLAAITTCLLAQYMFLVTAAYKAVAPTWWNMVAILAAFATPPLLALLVSRRFIVPLLLNVACFVWLAAVGLFFTGFAFLFSGDSHRHVQHPVQIAELVGTWEPTEKSLKLWYLENDYDFAGKSHSISFAADGGLSYSSYFDGKYLQSQGSWRLKQLDPNKKSSRNRVHLRVKGQTNIYAQPFSIMQSNEDYILWQNFSNDYIEYRRAKDDLTAKKKID